ncbi:hypothetical protein [Actinomadura barringtoniae]|uniref:hypothetical protein n=1 Tax=Actinomadura barringtoniae TaxID=1427535 RepID=UPI001FB727E3|nr:hypothetical protein [Actinomadura barringtoniae]
MDLMPFVDQLRREVALAAEAGGEDARALAERLMVPLESATRLVLLEALSAAADEITMELAPGAVEVRLRGRDPGFVVTAPPPPPRGDPAGTVASPPPAPVPQDADEGGTSRISLRVPESLKPRIDEAARRDGLSVNAWLVRAISAAVEPGGASGRGGPGGPGSPGGRRPHQSDHDYTGWVR